MSATVTPFQLRSGKSSYVHDPLHVRAVAFESGAGRAVICLIDAIGIGRDMSDTAKAKAEERTGWKAKCMLISPLIPTLHPRVEKVCLDAKNMRN